MRVRLVRVDVHREAQPAQNTRHGAVACAPRALALVYALLVRVRVRVGVGVRVKG